MTCVLVAPLGLYGAVLGVRESPRSALVVVAAAFGALALGLLPYAQTALAADTPASWGAGHSLHATVHHFLRMDYGAATLSAHGGDPVPVASELALAGTLARAYWWLPLALGLAAMFWRAARREPGTSRAAWVAYAASWLLAGPLFASRFNIDPHGFGLHVVERMHLLPELLLAVPVAIGLDWIGRARIAQASAAWGLAAFPLFVAPSLSAAAGSTRPRSSCRSSTRCARCHRTPR